jgi:hypothetical protein
LGRFCKITPHLVQYLSNGFRRSKSETISALCLLSATGLGLILQPSQPRLRRSSTAMTPSAMSRPTAAQLSNSSEGLGKLVAGRAVAIGWPEYGAVPTLNDQRFMKNAFSEGLV